jgi:hypothetical protein
LYPVRYPLAMSEAGTKMVEAAQKIGGVRANSTSNRNFYVSDEFAISRMPGDDLGDSMLVPFLKLQLLMHTLSWEFDHQFLPWEGQVGKFDAFTLPNTAAPLITLGYNNSPIFGENCGGAGAPVFPFLIGDVPSVAFHVSISTVPDGHVPIMVPPSLLRLNERNFTGMYLALLTAILAPYPFGLHTVSIATTDTAGGNAANQMFMPFSTCVQIPGDYVLDFILPIRYSDRVPGNLIDAQDMAFTVPTAGPTNWGAMLANDDLDINFAGGGYINYSVADYLGSWFGNPAASPVDATSLSVFAKIMTKVTKRGNDYRMAYEFASVLSNLYPSMQETVVGVPVFHAQNSAESQRRHGFFGLSATQINNNLPQLIINNDFVVPGCSTPWLSKVLSDLYICTDDGALKSDIPKAIDGAARYLQYSIYTARSYAITSSIIHMYHQQTVNTWNDLFNQTPLVGIAKTLRMYFTSASTSGNLPAHSKAGTQVAVMHHKLNGFAPRTDLFGYSVWHYMNSPQNGFTGPTPVGGGAPLSNVTTCILADVWIQVSSAKILQALSPFISAQKDMYGIQTSDHQMTLFAGGTLTIPLKVGFGQAHGISMNACPTLDDSEMWNSRWIWHSRAATMYTLDGVVFNVGLPATQNLICQKANRAYPSLSGVGRMAILQTAYTGWFPYNTNDGRRLAVGLTLANGSAAVSQIIAHRTPTAMPIWNFGDVTIVPNSIVGMGGDTDSGLWGEEDVSTALKVESPPLTTKSASPKVVVSTETKVGLDSGDQQ